MPYDKRDGKGKFEPTYTAQQFVDAIRALGGDATTSEVAAELGCAYRTAHARLSELDDSGTVTVREVGNSLLWSVTEENTTDE